MSAILQKDNFYFSHDANAKDDYKCMLLIDQMGLEGYGIFWVLIETLREQKNYKYPLQLVPSLSRKYNTTQVKMETVINAYGLFELDQDSFFFSGSLNRRMSFFEQKKAQQIEAGKKGVAAKKAKQEQLLLELSGDDSIYRPLTDPQAIKLKEKKLKEKKENTLFERQEESIVKKFTTFKKNFTQNKKNELFYTTDIGYMHDTAFYINELNLIVNNVNKKILEKEEAAKVWAYLYDYHIRENEQWK